MRPHARAATTGVSQAIASTAVKPEPFPSRGQEQGFGRAVEGGEDRLLGLVLEKLGHAKSRQAVPATMSRPSRHRRDRRAPDRGRETASSIAAKPASSVGMSLRGSRRPAKSMNGRSIPRSLAESRRPRPALVGQKTPRPRCRSHVPSLRGGRIHSCNSARVVSDTATIGVGAANRLADERNVVAAHHATDVAGAAEEIAVVHRHYGAGTPRR